MSLDITTCAEQLPQETKSYFRAVLLNSLSDDQKMLLVEIELSKPETWRHGHRGLYKDPIKMARSREIYNSNWDWSQYARGQ